MLILFTNASFRNIKFKEVKSHSKLLSPSLVAEGMYCRAVERQKYNFYLTSLYRAIKSVNYRHGRRENQV